MKTIQINNQQITIHHYHTLIVGAGAAGMNCAVHLYEFMTQKGVKNAEKKIGVITAGLGLGASRMSGSDKQTYYKMGTSPDVADSAEDFAKSITAAGCVHHDLALAEAIGSLREFYHLVQAGVPFPHDARGSYIGYKTDHDPYQRATSAGPKTSKFMSECLQRQAERYKIAIHDNQEVARLITAGKGQDKRIAAVVTVDRTRLSPTDYAINVFSCENPVLAAGGPGELYETTVYPQGQVGIHGLAFEAGLAAENLTESQFGLASIKFRWNVSGTYMQVIPRIYSTDADGSSNPREFLAEVFPTMREMASKIFMKGYQWPFDPQRIENHQSSLIDVLVFNETSQGRRVFMDFLHNPAARADMEAFDLEDLELEARMYLLYTGATQERPIDRLKHMNPLAIDIFAEHGIDLWTEPLEIAVCAQHNNGGIAVNKWWESNIPHTFVIGEMAGTHGVKRPGGSALNAGQTGGLRAAEYIANAYPPGKRVGGVRSKVLQEKLETLVGEMTAMFDQADGLAGDEVMDEIRRRMTASAGHIRRLEDARAALVRAVELYRQIGRRGFSARSAQQAVAAIQARHLALTSAAYLKAVVSLLEQGGGSRGSHLVLSDDGVEIHPSVIDRRTGRPLRFKKENVELRKEIQRVEFDPEKDDLFACQNVAARPAGKPPAAFEPAWEDFRKGKIYLQ
ncbi:MAG: FAD-binding protein [Thermoguttaceae bacterium]|jgi:succinate dehydrogenase/fumarate reductase flavoprotein subunit